MAALGISSLADTVRHDLVGVAREFVAGDLSHSFTADEERALRPFFTNLNKRVFFMHSLPSNVLATLASMFSRLKNKRGIRGVFVDSFLPGVLAGTLDAIGQDDAEVFLKNNKIKNLEDFLRYSYDAKARFNWFVDSSPSDGYLKVLTDSKKAKKFLNMYLDQYGHNSIARMGTVWLCFEQVSILAAKSVEWTRPGAGYVALSTRFVDRDGAGVYPIDKELRMLGLDTEYLSSHFRYLVRLYAELQGDKLDGPFPSFLREKWGELIEQKGGKVELGVAGETFDVLGNLLPAATLTSVAVAVSGESLPSILKHLIFDDTAENFVLAQLVIEEAVKVGADQFIRHYQPSKVDVLGWEYLNSDQSVLSRGVYRFESYAHTLPWIPSSSEVAELIFGLFEQKKGFRNVINMSSLADYLFNGSRLDHDKLPSEFEAVTVPFAGCMSFRSWRDLHRQGLSTHNRTLLTPYMGFYHYDKPQPIELSHSFQAAKQSSGNVYLSLDQIPPILKQYVLPMGFRIGFTYFANLRQHEFCNWQRTKPSVNHEVRQVFLSMENDLRRIYPWWPLFSRADLTPAYIFARGSAVPLPE
ncbi:MAG: FAD-dependent thymidylate synthase [Candidatus Taylorbacteria bacterium]|nr:FAD-dependent thymidylate synthase [Candidatus Taylorbacteria bacterium]